MICGLMRQSTSITFRVKENTKFQIEYLIERLGLWDDISDFVRSAISKEIDKHHKEEYYVYEH